jgi:hypothetical protein
VLVESHFHIHNVMCERARLDLLVSSLTKESVGLVIDIVENSPQHWPYSFLKDKFLAAHQLTEYQRIAHRARLELLDAMKLSELLAPQCWRSAPYIIFVHLFFEHLLAKLRIMLGEDDHQDPWNLANQADKL